MSGQPQSFLLLLAVPSHQLRLGQDMPFHGLQELLLGRATGKIEHRIQGVELEEVAVGAAGTAIICASPTVLAVPAAVRDVRVRRDALRQLTGVSWQVYFGGIGASDSKALLVSSKAILSSPFSGWGDEVGVGVGKDA